MDTIRVAASRQPTGYRLCATFCALPGPAASLRNLQVCFHQDAGSYLLFALGVRMHRLGR